MVDTSCANPECNRHAIGGTRNHWVQIEEVQLVGGMQGQVPMQRRFAAVACSKRCAAVVLAAAADVDDVVEADDADRRSRLFAQP